MKAHLVTSVDRDRTCREFFAAERVSVGAVAVSALSCQPPFIDCTPVNATRGVYESGGAKVCADWAL